MSRAWPLVLLPVLALAGCATAKPSAAAPEHAAAAAPARVRIAVDQPWGEAEDAARRQGYALHDASLLAMAPTPDGFNISMPGGRGLIVFRDRATQTVHSMLVVENWAEKGLRRYYGVPSVDVPPADADGR
jgi:hypothetical protein